MNSNITTKQQTVFVTSDNKEFHGKTARTRAEDHQAYLDDDAKYTKFKGFISTLHNLSTPSEDIIFRNQLRKKIGHEVSSYPRFLYTLAQFIGKYRWNEIHNYLWLTNNQKQYDKGVRQGMAGFRVISDIDATLSGMRTLGNTESYILGYKAGWSVARIESRLSKGSKL